MSSKAKKKSSADNVSQGKASCESKTEPKDTSEAYLVNMMRLKGYFLGQELGRGSFAVVRKARSAQTQQKLAIKIVDCSKAPDDFITHFFPRELNIIRTLKHENIVDFIDVIKVNWLTCIVMERAEGGDILDLIISNGPLKDDLASSIFRQLALALQFCHDQHIAHRDLKCENVLVTKDHKVKLADFGFCRSVVNKENMRVLSQTYCGSAAYAAPEVLLGRPYNPLMSDMWSLGVVLFIMICGVMPFDDGSHRRMVDDQRSRRWSFSPDRRAHISPNCRRVVRHLLEPDVTKRATMRQVLGSPWLSVSSGTQNFLSDLAMVAQKGRS